MTTRLETSKGPSVKPDRASFERAVVHVIQALRPGQVASYGEIAEEAGFPGAARAVGGVLSRSEALPWWRVVRADGRLVAPNEKKQARLLKKEGVRVEGGRVVTGAD
jgi:methylated-DNA-protein-cysteine methyltransferase related protein